jgi:hypothetical protein
MKIVLLFPILFLQLLTVCCNVEKDREIEIPETVVTLYKQENNIFLADSVKALAMLLNRECPECSFEEKIYVASCIVTGSKEEKVSWKTYLFEMKQFWGFRDKRIYFNPNEENHIENIKASIQAWENPKKVRFYTSKIDTSAHFRYVLNRNPIKKKGFYHYFTF